MQNGIPQGFLYTTKLVSNLGHLLHNVSSTAIVLNNVVCERRVQLKNVAFMSFQIGA
jgi:hypothetical protein